MFARTPKQREMLKRALNRRKQLLEALEARVHAYLLKVETDIETQVQLFERQQQELQQPPLDDLERMALQDAILASLEADIEANLQQAQERASRLESSIHWETNSMEPSVVCLTASLPSYTGGAASSSVVCLTASLPSYAGGAASSSVVCLTALPPSFNQQTDSWQEQRCKRVGDYYKLAETERREEEIIAHICLQEQSPTLRQKLEVQLQEGLAKQRDVKFDLTMELVTQVLNLGESAEDEAKFQSLCLQLQALSARPIALQLLHEKVDTAIETEIKRIEKERRCQELPALDEPAKELLRVRLIHARELELDAAIEQAEVALLAMQRKERVSRVRLAELHALMSSLLHD
ncbi:hypothetical protein C8J56DRAFT_899071 [Mycena floridula]|nr:hypothetical protein C8J56DRAFT_899071 [Mycena floridula]